MSSIASPTLWFITIGVVLALLVVDFIATRRPHEVSMKEAIGWSAFYVALPLAFGLYVWNVHGGDRGLEYYTGYLVEKTLSVDNLFVFMLLLAAFAVPEVLKQRVLLYGIIGALVLRGIFIALGAAALSRFDWVFLVFGAILLLTGVKLLRDAIRGQEHESTSPRCACQADAPLHAGHRRLRGHPAHRAPGRARAPLTPFALVTVAVLRHRHRLRRRLGAGGLRHHRRPLPGLRDQRLRPARPARALLRARGCAGRAVPPQLRPGRDPGLHRRQAGAALGAPGLAVGPRRADPRLAVRDRRHPGRHDHHEPVGQQARRRGARTTSRRPSAPADDSRSGRVSRPSASSRRGRSSSCRRWR